MSLQESLSEKRSLGQDLSKKEVAIVGSDTKSYSMIPR